MGGDHRSKTEVKLFRILYESNIAFADEFGIEAGISRHGKLNLAASDQQDSVGPQLRQNIVFP